MKKNEYSFDGLVWQIKADENSGFIALEIRQKDRKEVDFFTLHISTGTIAKVHHHFEEKWLWGMECIHNGILIIHGYRSAQSPEHQYLIAYDAKTGNKLWENFTHAFDSAGNDYFNAYNFMIEPKKLVRLNINDGTLMSEAGSQKLAIDHSSSIIGLRFPTSDLPHQTSDFNDYQIKSFIEDGKQFIEIVHPKKNINIKEIIAEPVESLPLDSFFIFGEHLIFIKNKFRLVSYLLE